MPRDRRTCLPNMAAVAGDSDPGETWGLECGRVIDASRVGFDSNVGLEVRIMDRVGTDSTGGIY